MIPVDAHVHIYPCHDRTALLDSAASHFAAQGAKSGVLLLAERAQEDAFGDLSTTSLLGGWSLRPAGDAGILAERNDAKILLAAGRQIVTADGLEVLSLLSTRRVADRLATQETLTRVLQDDGVAVLPWGFGKWTGRRGELVNELLAGPLGDRVFVGDNAGRLSWSAMPPQLCSAMAKKRWMLPGSDPLPLPREAARAGSYGLMLEAPLDPDAVRQAILDLREQPRTYGELTGPLRFLRNQTHMQLRKRLGKKQPLAA